MVEASNIDALDLLKQEMNTEEIHLKVNVIHRMKTVILSIMGTQNISTTLVPYLESLIGAQDDEVLFAIAEEIGEVFSLLPDKTVFLGLLEQLAKQDETVVREQATASLLTICDALDDNDLQNSFCPLVIRLAGAEWFTGRVSACSLFYKCYPKANAQKERLRKKFMELCQEDTPMIRRVCAAKLGTFAQQLEKQHVIQELLPIFRQLSQDDQDSCRVLCIESLIPMAQYLSKEENRVHTLGSLLNAGEDKSWKVRLCFARNFTKFADAFGSDITNNNLIQTFNLLLTDNEPEVKNAAIKSLQQSLTFVSTERICNMILPTIQSTWENSQVVYKAGVALALSEMAKSVGKQYCVTIVLPILMELMKDDNSEVRLNVTKSLKACLKEATGEFITQNFKAALVQLTKDSQWRVKMEAFRLIGDIALEGILTKEQFSSTVQDVFFQYLQNTAAEVRKEGVDMLKKIAAKYGQDWCLQEARPVIINEGLNADAQVGYNYRMTCLNSLSALIPNLQAQLTEREILPEIMKGCNDRIPNVQFCAIRIVESHLKETAPENFATAQYVRETMSRQITQLMEDADLDVAFYASKAQKEMQGYLNRA